MRSPAAVEWTPDGRGVAYAVLSNIWVQPVDGSAPTQLTHLPEDGRRIEDFEWSPDGKRLAFSRSKRSWDIVLFRESRPSEKGAYLSSRCVTCIRRCTHGARTTPMTPIKTTPLKAPSIAKQHAFPAVVHLNRRVPFRWGSSTRSRQIEQPGDVPPRGTQGPDADRDRHNRRAPQEMAPGAPQEPRPGEQAVL